MAKILIARLGALGDILHALPAVTAIRAALPQATIGWLVEERWTELLTTHHPKPDPESVGPQKPVANLIHTVDTMRWRRRMFRSGTIPEVRGALRRVRDVNYDFAIDFQGAIKSGLLARLSGARSVAGFENPREPAARILYSQKFSRKGEHVIEQNHALAAGALKDLLGGKDLEFIAPQLPCDPDAETWAQSEIMRLGIASFALVTPAAGWGAKQWPPERFGAVAQALTRHNLKTLVNAAPGEEGLAQAVVDASAGNAFVVQGNLGQLIALTRRARIFIGGDTGPLHLACAQNVPTVGLYGPTDPIRTGPFGRSTIALRHPESKTTFSHHRRPDSGLLKISPEEVIGAARHLLGGARA